MIIENEAYSRLDKYNTEKCPCAGHAGNM